MGKLFKTAQDVDAYFDVKDDILHPLRGYRDVLKAYVADGKLLGTDDDGKLQVGGLKKFLEVKKEPTEDETKALAGVNKLLTQKRATDTEPAPENEWGKWFRDNAWLLAGGALVAAVVSVFSPIAALLVGALIIGGGLLMANMKTHASADENKAPDAVVGEKKDADELGNAKTKEADGKGAAEKADEKKTAKKDTNLSKDSEFKVTVKSKILDAGEGTETSIFNHEFTPKGMDSKKPLEWVLNPDKDYKVMLSAHGSSNKAEDVTSTFKSTGFDAPPLMLIVLLKGAKFSPDGNTAKIDLPFNETGDPAHEHTISGEFSGLNSSTIIFKGNFKDRDGKSRVEWDAKAENVPAGLINEIKQLRDKLPDEFMPGPQSNLAVPEKDSLVAKLANDFKAGNLNVDVDGHLPGKKRAE